MNFLEINNQIYFTINNETRIFYKDEFSLFVKDLIEKKQDDKCLYSIHHLLYYYKMKQRINTNILFTLEGEPIVYLPINFDNAIFTLYTNKRIQIFPKETNYIESNLFLDRCLSAKNYTEQFVLKVSLQSFYINSDTIFFTSFNPISLYRDGKEKLIFNKCPIFHFNKKEAIK